MVGTSNKSVPGMAIEKVGISPAKVVISCDLWLFYQHEISKGIPNESTKASYSISSFRLMIQLTKKKTPVSSNMARKFPKKFEALELGR